MRRPAKPRLHLAMWSNDFSTRISVPKTTAIVKNVSWSYLGGCEQADIEITGRGAPALLEYLNFARAPIEIIDEHGQAVWWGYVRDIDAQIHSVKYGLSLGDWFDRLAIQYDGGQTSWAQDAASIARLGTKELIQTIGLTQSAQADNYRDTLLAQIANPQPVVTPNAGGDDLRVTLTARGWWETLGWEYYTKAAYSNSYWPPTYALNIGGVDDSVNAVVTEIVLAQAWLVNSITVNAGVAGTHGYPNRYRISTQSGGPYYAWNYTGTVLVSVDTPDNPSGDYTLTVSPPVILPAGSYWFSCEYTRKAYMSGTYCGTRSSKTTYQFNENTGMSITDIAPCYQLSGVEDTSVQVASVVAGVGQFLTGSDVSGDTGIITDPTQDGTRLGLDIAEELLRSGTTNFRRLIAEVTRDRRVRVTEELPASVTGAELRLRSNGQVEDEFGQPWPIRNPCGKWCVSKDVIPFALSTLPLTDPTLFHVDRAEYDAEQGTWLLEPRGAPNSLDILQLRSL